MKPKHSWKMWIFIPWLAYSNRICVNCLKLCSQTFFIADSLKHSTNTVTSMKMSSVMNCRRFSPKFLPKTNSPLTLFWTICWSKLRISFRIHTIYFEYFFTLFLFFFYFFPSQNRIHRYENENKMSLHNLAMVFGPTLLRTALNAPKQKDQLETSTVDVMAQAGILYCFLQARKK